MEHNGLKIITKRGYIVAEFYLKCFNKLNRSHYQANEVWLENDFCEGCAEWRPCVIDLHPKPPLRRLMDWFCSLFHK